MTRSRFLAMVRAAGCTIDEDTDGILVVDAPPLQVFRATDTHCVSACWNGVPKSEAYADLAQDIERGFAACAIENCLTALHR